MHAITSPTPAAGPHEGLLDLRLLIQWLAHDDVISRDEARRTLTRCGQTESRQSPLMRLANVAMTRQSDGKPLDLETLTQWLAVRAGLAYLRIDPLKVDVGKVADTMSAAYAERHKVLPVQVLQHEVVIATAELFITDWVAEVERQSRRTVRRVVANPADIQRYTVGFLHWPTRCAQRKRQAATRVRRASSNWLNWGKEANNWTPTTRAWCRWWIGSGDTLSTSVPVIFIWSHGASMA